jgi:hypothetical protein
VDQGKGCERVRPRSGRAGGSRGRKRTNVNTTCGEDKQKTGLASARGGSRREGGMDSRGGEGVEAGRVAKESLKNAERKFNAIQRTREKPPSGGPWGAKPHRKQGCGFSQTADVGAALCASKAPAICTKTTMSFTRPFFQGIGREERRHRTHERTNE